MTQLFREYFSLHRKFLVYNLIYRNIQIRYRKSILGMLWTVLIPAVQALVYYMVFTRIMQVRSENYLLLIMSSIIPWTFFANSIAAGTETLVNNQSLLNKVNMPIQSLVFAECLTQFLNLIYSLPVLVVIMLMSSVNPTWATVQYLPLTAALFLITYALAFNLSIMHVYFRDLKHLISLCLQLWFYLTPVIYGLDMIPEKYRFLLAYSPIGFIFDGFHKSLHSQVWISPEAWAVILAWTVGLTGVAILNWRKNKNDVIEIL